MQTIGTQSVTAENTRVYAAYQSKRGRVPAPVSPEPAAYWDLQVETADVGRSKTYDRVRPLSAGREEGKPVLDSIDAAQSLTTFLDKREFGFHLGALLGTATSEDAAATGFLMFDAQPEDGGTLVINGVTWTFVDAAAGSSETEIGSSLTATILNLATDLNAEVNASIAEASYLASGHRLIVTSNTAGEAGNVFTLGAGTGAHFASAETLRGGGLRRHRFVSGKKDLPLVSLVTEQTDLTDGPRFKAVKDIRYNGMQFAIQKNGAARVTFSAIGVNEIVLEADPVAGHTVDADVDRYSNLQGGILIDDECVCGVVEGGQISYSNGLTANRALCCPGDPDSAGITDSVPGQVACEVTVNARYYDAAVTGKAENGDTVKIVHQFYDKTDGSSLTFTFAQVTLPETTRNLRAGAAIVQNFSGIASRPPAGWSMVVDLVNDVTGY